MKQVIAVHDNNENAFDAFCRARDPYRDGQVRGSLDAARPARAALAALDGTGEPTA